MVSPRQHLQSNRHNPTVHSDKRDQRSTARRTNGLQAIHSSLRVASPNHNTVNRATNHGRTDRHSHNRTSPNSHLANTIGDNNHRTLLATVAEPSHAGSNRMANRSNRLGDNALQDSNREDNRLTVNHRRADHRRVPVGHPLATIAMTVALPTTSHGDNSLLVVQELSHSVGLVAGGRSSVGQVVQRVLSMSITVPSMMLTLMQ